MINLAIIFDSFEKGGGGFYQSLATAKLVKNINQNNIKKIYFCTTKTTQNILRSHKIESKLIQINFFEKILNKLDEIDFFSFILKKLKFRNSIHKISEKNKIDLFYFLGPSNLVNLIKNSEKSNFMINIWDINHKINTYFPEYKSIETYNSKEKILKKTVNNAYKIIINSQKALEDMKVHYNCDENKMSIMPFRTPLPEIYENKSKEDFDEIFKKFNIEKKNKIFFYPAQFWPHKNHVYLLDALKNLLKYNKNFTLILTGDNKGNLDLIKKKIVQDKLEQNIEMFNFLTVDEIISIYTNSDALIMPTFVARTTLPLLEALYFQLPIFYSKNILDTEYSKYVKEFDLNRPNELTEILDDFIQNPQKYKKIAENGKNFYQKISDKNKAILKLNSIFDEYIYLSSRWK
ncbi:glycosyltransferase [Candidatus Pelagibacter sp.]|uniref:glycosyltransferase n=1 Tax=Candidatus Pelagibacter sp. TaxID=2024849 RepID=UPI003F82A713